MNAVFHQVFIRRARNPRLPEEIDKFRILMRRFRLVLMKTSGRMITSASEHAAIIDAFVARDATRAEALVREHLTSAEKTLRQVLDAVRTLA